VFDKQPPNIDADWQGRAVVGVMGTLLISALRSPTVLP
jgi:hypothetical protein